MIKCWKSKKSLLRIAIKFSVLIFYFFQLIKKFRQLKNLPTEQPCKAENVWNEIKNKSPIKVERVDSGRGFSVMSAILYNLLGEDEERVSNILIFAPKVHG